MPKYARRGYKKRRTNRAPKHPKSWRDYQVKVGYIADKAYQGFKYLRGLVNSEMYKNDTNWTATTLSTSGVIAANACAIAQGDGISGRTGNSILVKSVNANLLFDFGTVDNMVRLMFFIDKQQISDTTPSVTDILESASPTAFLNKNTVGRFSVLYDQKFVLDSAQHRLQIKKVHLGLQHHVRYNGTASTDIQKGSIYMLVIASGSDGTWAGDLRCNYHDN